MDHPFIFRPGTMDEEIFHSVVTHNEYRLPDTLQAEDIIVDIGAHIGSFCYAALRRGSEHVYGFEPVPGNYECAVRNLQAFGDYVHLYNKAIWRSDREGVKLRLTPSDNLANTAGGSVIWAHGQEEVSAVAFDDVLRDITADGRKRVKMLKIDCEGAEFPILLTSHMLQLIDHIYGEFHEMGGEYDNLVMHDHVRVPGFNRFTIVELTDVLQRSGFNVVSARYGESNFGFFFASREQNSGIAVMSPVQIDLGDSKVYSPYPSNGLSDTVVPPWEVAFQQRRVDVLKRLFRRYIPAGSRVLSAGSSIIDQIAGTSWSYRITRLDYNSQLRYQISPEHRGHNWMVAAIEKLPFADASFDALYASKVIEHVPDGDAALAEWRRVLRPGGTLIVTTPNRARLLNRINHTTTPVSYERLVEFTCDELSAMFERNGFEVLKREGIYLELLSCWRQRAPYVDPLTAAEPLRRHLLALKPLMLLGRPLPQFAFDMVFVGRKRA
jgi:FkbM family methyltransferase